MGHRERSKAIKPASLAASDGPVYLKTEGRQKFFDKAARRIERQTKKILRDKAIKNLKADMEKKALKIKNPIRAIFKCSMCGSKFKRLISRTGKNQKDYFCNNKCQSKYRRGKNK